MTALTQPLNNCAISFSELDSSAGLIGAGAFVFEQYGLIE